MIEKRALNAKNFLSLQRDKGKYKQALRGLFTAGTSPCFCKKKQNKRKGRWQTGIESFDSARTVSGKRRDVPTTSAGTNRK